MKIWDILSQNELGLINIGFIHVLILTGLYGQECIENMSFHMRKYMDLLTEILII